MAIPQGVLRQAVLLSERYITDRYLPDKAIDLIDEACSDKNLHDPDINRRMELERELENLTFERENLMSAQPADGQEFTQEELDRRYERIAELRSQELRVTDELNAIRAKGTPQLTMDNIARVIEMWTKIPASKIKEEEFKRLAELDQRLRAHVVGQDEAIAAVSAAIRRNRVGISPKHKPVSFIFVGPTGVGKTELVKQLADDLFDAPESLIRLDMSEFMEKHSVSRIVGSPPGYVGYDEAGQLTEKIRRKMCIRDRPQSGRRRTFGDVRLFRRGPGQTGGERHRKSPGGGADAAVRRGVHGTALRGLRRGLSGVVPAAAPPAAVAAGAAAPLYKTARGPRHQRRDGRRTGIGERRAAAVFRRLAAAPSPDLDHA